MHIETVIDFKELGKRYRFKNPTKELIADTLEQVLEVIKEVDYYQSQNYYVVGYLSYEASAAFDSHFKVSQQKLAGEHLAYFTVHKDCENEAFPLSYENVRLADNWTANVSEQEYQEAIANIKGQIRQGNTYQVNYTLELSQQLCSDPFSVYERLMVEQGAGYNAYIAYDDKRILSVSPELFFKKKDEVLTTRPMKGTSARKPTYQEDVAERDWLANDPKNRSENMMIVDLLRNDMGRICDVGTVKVKKLCQVEQYATVWQMTSTIEGVLSPEVTLMSIFQALYPCGSITGAPKISTMAIINELEKRPRGIYCGTIGLCMPDGQAIFNVPIRTVQMKGQQAYYGVGGGITWESQTDSEYEETRQKSAVLTRVNPKFQLITTGRVTENKLLFSQQHVERLIESASYFAFFFDKSKFERELKKYLHQLDEKDYRLKIMLDKTGKVTFEVKQLVNLSKKFLTAEVVVQDYPIKLSPFTYFKTSYRPHIIEGQNEKIFVSPEGLLLETSIGNIVLEKNGRFLTPDLSEGGLNGIYRRHLLKNQKVIEAPLTLKDLESADAIYACNAVRGLYPLNLK